MDYKTRAYKDQTGSWRDGYVVYDQVILTDTEKRLDYNDGYVPTHKDLIRVYSSEDGRIFHLRPETVDYGGGTHVRLVEGGPVNIIDPGYWRAVPHNFERHVSMSGQPVQALMVR